MSEYCIPLIPTVGLDGNWKADNVCAGVTHPEPQHPINYDCLHHGTPERCVNYMVPDPAQNKSEG